MAKGLFRAIQALKKKQNEKITLGSTGTLFSNDQREHLAGFNFTRIDRIIYV
jgi:hypothetical protein